MHRNSLHNFSLVKPFQLVEVAWCDSGHGRFVPTQASTWTPGTAQFLHLQNRHNDALHASLLSVL